MLPDSADPFARVEVAVMARAPIPGQAKTRLIPLLGDVGAAQLQRWLLQRTVAMAVVADVGPVSLWCAGQPDHPDFAICGAFGSVKLCRQPEGDLGVRMLAAARDSHRTAGTLIIGTDCPAMTSRMLRQAALLLRENDAVVFPAEDGGYVLIGMRRREPEVFENIDWGTDRVLVQTRQRLAELGWQWAEPATLWDIDRPADYERLAEICPDVPGAQVAP